MMIKTYIAALLLALPFNAMAMGDKIGIDLDGKGDFIIAETGSGIDYWIDKSACLCFVRYKGWMDRVPCPKLRGYKELQEHLKGCK